jgi:hypothetical protein
VSSDEYVFPIVTHAQWVRALDKACGLHVSQACTYILILSCPVSKKLTKKCSFRINPLTPELNPSAQRCLARFFTWDFASLEREFR